MRRAILPVLMLTSLTGCVSWQQTPVITADANKAWPAYSDCIAASLKARQDSLNGSIWVESVPEQSMAMIGIADAQGTETNIRVVATSPQSSQATAILGVRGEREHRSAAEDILYGCAAL
ncbi:MAG: hypothetical protein IT548_16935 [Alphaproteobacteria bacterium]|nr:hypothetical protein [Alphaproteobacteria bacterium]